MITRTYDRIKSPKRDQKLIRPEIRASARPRTRYWDCPVTLDQGLQGSCVGHAIAHEIAAMPLQRKVDSKLAFRIYKEAQKIDEWPGEDYHGTSVWAGMRVACDMGYYDFWRWAYNIEDLCLAISHRGPAVLGIDWYESMERPTRNGFVVPRGRMVGGHGILCNGYHARYDFYRLHNSWGNHWGLNGDCFITGRDLSKLMKHGGEAAIPLSRN